MPTANEVIATVYEDSKWKEAVINPNTTNGIQDTLKAHAAAIQAIADYLDKVKVAPTNGAVMVKAKKSASKHAHR